MKYSYNIITDATSDFPVGLYEEDFAVIPMSYVIDGKLYTQENCLSHHEFYERMRNGAMPTTSLINTSTAIEFFTPYFEKGHDIFFVCFSSALSGTYKSMLEAKEELAEKFPERKLYILDSRCAAGGEGLLTYYCLKKRREGASFEELTLYAEELKNHCRHDFAVDSLMHLFRGGRISKSTAIVGTAMHVKPILTVSTDGSLVTTSKVVGRKNAYKMLIDKMEAKSKGFDNSELVWIDHSDCYDDAMWVKQKLEERFGYKNVMINELSPIIGTHTGPDTVMIFYLGIDKDK